MLTDAKIRNAKPDGKSYRLVDAASLHLSATPAGSRVWRWRYKVGSREQLLTIDPYPDISLAKPAAGVTTPVPSSRSERILP